jgi:acyl-CoA reductase-like NAD-dependent aldehyde dehydrogenase
MNHLAIHNPATGTLITTVDADDAASVTLKTGRARAAQAAWAATPLAARKVCIERFAAAVRAELEPLAAIMTRETGKPIKMSRNELNGLMGRIDFFLGAVDATLATETVFADGGMTEQIQHTPLGVVVNISAWNYPWFVGGNVFVPALLAGATDRRPVFHGLARHGRAHRPGPGAAPGQTATRTRRQGPDLRLR